MAGWPLSEGRGKLPTGSLTAVLVRGVVRSCHLLGGDPGAIFILPPFLGNWESPAVAAEA